MEPEIKCKCKRTSESLGFRLNDRHLAFLCTHYPFHRKYYDRKTQTDAPQYESARQIQKSQWSVTGARPVIDPALRWWWLVGFIYLVQSTRLPAINHPKRYKRSSKLGCYFFNDYPVSPSNCLRRRWVQKGQLFPIY